MELKINSHVSRLNRYLPFSASHDQIYEEYQSDEDGLNLETKALSFTIEAVRSKASCIVLTGDAGHGKTHLCRRLLVDYLEYDQSTSRTLLRTSCDGEHLISHPASPKTHQSLRIHKDFSEIDPKVAAEFIEKHVATGDSTLVICANEGRLRAIISSAGAGAVCANIQTTFQHSFKSGLASADGIQTEISNEDATRIPEFIKLDVTDGLNHRSPVDALKLLEAAPTDISKPALVSLLTRKSRKALEKLINPPVRVFTNPMLELSRQLETIREQSESTLPIKKIRLELADSSFTGPALGLFAFIYGNTLQEVASHSTEAQLDCILEVDQNLITSASNITRCLACGIPNFSALMMNSLASSSSGVSPGANFTRETSE